METSQLLVADDLHISLKRLRLYIENSPLALIEWDEQFRITNWSNKAEKMFGWAAEEVLGKTPDEFNFVYEGDVEQVSIRMEELLRGKSNTNTNRNYTKDGRVISAEWSNSVLTDEHGKIISILSQVLDVTEREMALRELKLKEERLSLAREAIHAGIYDCNFIKKDFFLGTYIRDVFGLPRDMKIYSPEIYEESIHPDDLPHVREAIANVFQRKSDRFALEMRAVNRKDHSVIWTEVTGKALYANGKLCRLVGTIKDITARKSLEHSLRGAIATLQDIDEKKNNFLSVLGHELRNPLAALSGSIEILNKQIPDNIKIFNIMKHSVYSMAKLLDDLLDLNRISQDKIRLHTSSVDIYTVLENVLAGARADREALLKPENLEIVTDIREGLWVAGDPVRLEQIFSNIITNARKYTPEGGKIEIMADRMDDTVRVSIRDNGIGMDPETKARLFEPFFQGKSGSNHPAGLGLGMALTKKLVDLHKGSINAYSAGKGRGSTFTVHLPVWKQDTKEAEVRQAENGRTSVPHKKVLLIEDNPDIIVTMPLLLEMLNCEVKTAETAKQGLDLAETFNPDAMIVDIGLPDMSGHEVAENIRAGGYKKLLVALSGYSHKEVRDKSKEAGFDHHLAKPVSLSDLEAVLSKAA